MDDFHTKSNKNRYLHDAVLGKIGENISLMNISMSLYDFTNEYRHWMRVSSMIERSQRSLRPLRHTAACSKHILRTYANIIPHPGMIEETVEHIDPNDAMIPTNIISATNDTTFDRLISSWYTNHEARTDSEKTHAISDRSHSSSCSRLKDRRPCWSNEYPRTNSYLRNMSYIGCCSSQHTLADRKCTLSL